MIFANPWLLWLIPFFIALLILAHRRGLSGGHVNYPFSGRSLKKSLGRQPSLLVPLLLRCLIVIFLVVAIARPQTSSTESKRSSDGIDIMIVFDVSKSMLIEDTRDRNRLDIAKDTVREFVRKRSDDRIGFLMFAGESITLCPPTLDYEVLESAIESANTEQLKDGTAIGDALASSVNRLKESTARSKIVILITDGDSNMGSIAPLTAGSLAKGYGIKVYSIALGREGAVDMPVIVSFFGQERKQYQKVNSTINPELLMKIASETGGKFFRAAEEGAMREVLSEIDKLERSKVEVKHRVQWEEHFKIPLLIAMLIMLLDFFLSRSRYRILPS